MDDEMMSKDLPEIEENEITDDEEEKEDDGESTDDDDQM